MNPAPSTCLQNAPLVSIVIPCYRQAHLLNQAIESALAQTHPNIEVVVVDDGSPDNTSEVAARYPGVRCIRQRNQGLPAARNTGLQASRGEYVDFLDADDRLTPVAVERHLRCFAAHPDAALVVGDITWIRGDGTPIETPPWDFIESAHYEALLRVNHVANTIAVMFRRSAFDAVGNFDVTLPAAEDYEMILRVARALPIAHHRTVVAEYRRYDSSMSRNGVLMLRTTLGVLRRQRPWIGRDPKLRAAYRRGQQHWCSIFGERVIEELRAHLARGALIRATGMGLVLLWYCTVPTLFFLARRLRSAAARILSRTPLAARLVP